MAMTIQDITEGERKELLGELLQPTSDERAARDHVRMRYNILHDRVTERELDQWIIDKYHQPEIAVEVMRHKLRLHNPVKRAVDRLAVLYSAKPTRAIMRGDKPLKDASKQWEAFTRRMLFDKHMRKFNRYAVAANAGVVVARPRRARGKSSFDFIPVLKSIGRAVREDGTSMQDPPGILAWMTADPADWRTKADAPVMATADSRWILQWNRDQKLIPSLTVEHDLGRFPGSTFRNTLPDDSCPLDFWDPWTNSPLLDAQKHVFRIAAEMNWTRKTQAGKIITAAINDEAPAGAQPFAGQTPGDRDAILIARGNAVQVSVHDLTTLIDGFESHMNLIMNVSMELLTGTIASFVPPNPTAPIDPEVARRMQGALTQHLLDQIDYFEETESDLAEVLALWGHKTGVELPAVEQVRDGFACSFAELPSLETAMERLDLHEKRIAMGLESLVDARMDETGETRDEAKAAVLRKLEEQAEFNALRSSRNSPTNPADADPNAIPNDAEPGERDEAETGRAGGRISRPPPPAPPPP